MLENIKKEIPVFIDECFGSVRSNYLFFFALLLLLIWMPLEYGARYMRTQTAGQVITASLILLLFNQKNKVFFKYPLWSISIFWIFILSSSLFFSSSKMLSLEELMRNIMYITLPITIFGWADSESRRKLISYSIIGAGSLVSLISIFYFFVNYYQTMVFEPTSVPLSRTNDLGAYLLLIFPLSFSNFLYEDKRYIDKFVYAFASLISFITIILTFSRGIWLSTLLAIIMILIFGFKILKKNIIYLGTIGVLALIPVVMKWDAIVNRILSLQNIFNNAENSIEWRKSLIKGCLNIFLDNPIIGTGLNTFSQVFSLYQEKAGYFSINPHNYYLQLLAETGMIGFSTFIILVISILYMSFKAFRNSESIFKGISLGLFVSIISSLLHISVDIEWSVASIPILFWIEVGCLISIYSAVNFKETRFSVLSDRFDYIKKPSSFLIALSLLIIPVSSYFASFFFNKSLQLERTGEFEKSKTYNYLAMNILPANSGRMANNYAKIMLKEDNLQDALYYSQKAIKADVYNYNYYKTYSDILMKISPNNAPKALESLIVAVKFNPYIHPKLYKQVADFYFFQMKNQTEAINWLKDGITHFTLGQLAHYERYTPEDRYQLYFVYNTLGELLAKDSPLTSKEYLKKAKIIINNELTTPAEDQLISKPVATVRNYWASINKKESLDIYIDLNADIPTPPNNLHYEILNYINIEHHIFSVTVEYNLSIKNKQEKKILTMKDNLVLTEKGWKISNRIIGAKNE